MFANLKMKYRLVVTDTETGKLVKRTKWRNSRSFTIQFLQNLQVQMEHANQYLTDITNTSRLITIDSHAFRCDAPENSSAYGIVVGTDNTAEQNSDYALGTQIVDGSGAGQLDHSSHTWIDAAEVGANVDMYIQRPFINNSGGAITIEECGIYVYSTTYTLCIVRDTTGGVTVNDEQTCTVEYLFRTTV